MNLAEFYEPKFKDKHVYFVGEALGKLFAILGDRSVIWNDGALGFPARIAKKLPDIHMEVSGGKLISWHPDNKDEYKKTVRFTQAEPIKPKLLSHVQCYAVVRDDRSLVETFTSLTSANKYAHPTDKIVPCFGIFEMEKEENETEKF